MKQKIFFKGVFMLVFLLGLNACKQTFSDEKMLQILEQTKKRVHNFRNSFCSEARFAYLDSLMSLKSQNAQETYKNNHIKANLLLELGKPNEAVQILEGLLKDNGDIPKQIKQRVADDLAVAYLRVGEQTNCIINHSVEACILPIKGGGIHKNATGSRGTIEIYKPWLKENPDDLEARWLLNIAYMTLGEYPHNVPKEMLIPNLDQSKSLNIKPFEDIAPDLGLDVNNMAGGVIIEDFDNDGYLDIVTSSWNIVESMHYFKNNGDGTFTDKSEASRLKKFSGGLQIVQTDYNNDGYKDIFVLRGAWITVKEGEQPNSLLRNNQDGTFTDVTIESGLLSFGHTQTATWNDFNNDGWLDVFIGNETTNNVNHLPCQFFINNKNGTFTDIADVSKCNITAFVKGVTSGDYDNDGWQDLFISTMSSGRFLLKNKGLVDGKVQFEDFTYQSGLARESNRSFATWFWDFDNDGWLDILVNDYTFGTSLGYYAAAEQLGKSPEFHGQPILYKNNRNGTFTNITNAIGLDKTAYAMGSNFGDIDNDGYLDIFLGTGNPSYKSLIPNKMFKNMGGKSFEDITTAAKVGSLQKGHGVAFGDMDNDGDQDIYIEMGGAYIGDAYQSSFFQNPGQNNNQWLSLSLEGTNSNKVAIGTRIKITFRENGKKRSVYRDVNSGSSFGASTLKREIGLGQATIIDELEIKWHGSGLVQKFTNIAPNQFIKIKEGNKNIEKIQLKNFTFKKHAHQHITMCLPNNKTTM